MPIMRPIPTTFAFTLFLLLFGGTVAGAAQSNAQQMAWYGGIGSDAPSRGLEQVITLDLRNALLVDALEEVGRKADLALVYSSSMLPVRHRVSLKARRITARNALIRLLERTSLELRSMPSGQIVIVPTRTTDRVHPAELTMHLNSVADLPPAFLPRGRETALGTISGRVVDGSTQQPLAGASVILEGTDRGVLTQADGSFLLTGVPAGTHRVRASTIGYAAQTQEVTVSAQQTATVRFELQPQAVLMEEVVAVGYGTQRRASLTGAVATVTSEQLTERPVARITEALQGSTPGMTIVQRSAAPGRQSIEFNIRGRGSLNPTSPLVLIDGVPGDIDQLNPNEIDNIAVLKDAGSAAIYGARAANGVVLITTRRGATTGSLRMSYSGYYGIQGVSRFPEPAGARDYLELINESYINGGLPPRYSEEFIQGVVKTYEGAPDADPIRFPWTDWRSVLFSPAPIQEHTFTVSGGNELGRFNLSLNAFDHQGMIPQTAADRMGMRLNTDFNVTPRLQTSVDVALHRSSDMEPHVTNRNTAIHRIFHSNKPWVVPKYPDGTYGWSNANHNPLAYAEALGRHDRVNTHGTLSSRADYELFEGFTLRTLASVRTDNRRSKNWRNEVEFRNYYDPTIVHVRFPEAALWQNKDTHWETYLRGMGEYDRAFGVHNVTAILGYDQTAADWDRIESHRRGHYSNDLQEINAGDPARQATGGTSYQWRLRSGFGRLAYAYDDRYMLEVNGRYDGSSRFTEGNRFGFFPSVAVAWRISEEDFFRNNVGFIDELKLRGSWGRTGNQDIVVGNSQVYYPYHSLINLSGNNYVFGGILTPGAAQAELANRNISWESTQMRNLGLDLEFLNRRLSFIGEMYRSRTDGILLRLPIAAIVGLTAPVQNAGVIENVGWEAAVNWRDQRGGVTYNVGFNFSDNRNTVVDLAGTGPYISGLWITQEGLPLGTMWGYEAMGLFRDQADVNSHATQPSPLTGPGDIKFRDQNGDGVIDADDRVVIGNELPRYTIGSQVGASFRGFDISAFFQGVLKVDAYLEGALIEGPVWENYTTAAWLDRWTEQNPNPNARMPRPALNQHHNHGTFSSFWVQDAAYLKLKTAQLGYTVPRSVAERIGLGLSGMRIYVAGQNLLTFTRDDLILDPEFPSGRGMVYPQTRTVSIGTSLQF
jgi:TonB-linked SusC/RagA family outer membrane protein